MSEQAAADAAARGPLNLLIVDDSAMMRAMIKRVTRVCGVPIGELLRGRQRPRGHRVLESQMVDAVFTDINMPVMTGTELLRAIEQDGRWPSLLRVNHLDGRLGGAARGGRQAACAALPRETLSAGGDA